MVYLFFGAGAKRKVFMVDMKAEGEVHYSRVRCVVKRGMGFVESVMGFGVVLEKN